ncbi:MAG: Uncharacterized protein XD91_1036 [Clostridiales bacterium 38_11]|nr:MAG: Uncharacterized protein XD91_1036 [Clostridiales bacterium 38_11]HBH12679.1 gamma carbonic anhydrase family protein [Clostridiales bacterium]
MIVKIDGFETKIHEETKIMETAVVIGSVEMKRKSSVWFNAVVRGDRDKIVIGEYSIIQDCSVVHTAIGYPTIVGDYVLVGHNANLHGCTVGNNCMIGIGAILLDGCTIGDNCIISAGALIPPGKVVPDHSMVIGNPYRIVRKVTDEELEDIKRTAIRYFELVAQYY